MSFPSTTSKFAALLAAGSAMLALSIPATAYGQDKVTKCPAPYGTVAINEPSQDSLNYLYGFNLGSPSSLLRVFAQESNCFIAVERGKGMDNMKAERPRRQRRVAGRPEHGQGADDCGRLCVDAVDSRREQ